MKDKTSHPILITIIIILSVAFCAALFTVISQNFRTPVVEEAPEETTSSIPGDTKPYNFDYSWLDHPYIAHAMGSIDGYTYTNSYEAFLLNYQLGHRVFEVDFDIADDQIVLSHDSSHWQKNATVKLSNDSSVPDFNTTAFTYNNFMSSLWYDKYHPLDLEDLLHLMQSHPDIYIVTDSKYTDKATVQSEFDMIVKLAKSIDETLLDRFVIQIYHPEMLDWVMEIHPWKSVLYTLYAVWNTWTPENVLAFAEESGIKVITIVGSWVNQTVVDTWKDANLTIIPHTINNLNDVKRFSSFGITHFYTDYLLPEIRP